MTRRRFRPISARLYSTMGVMSRKGREVQFILTYADEHREGAQLIHHVPCAQEDRALPNEN